VAVSVAVRRRLVSIVRHRPDYRRCSAGANAAARSAFP
jgi:hypothetical protein